ncbi:hypothetical protein FIBSPDRAFT_866248, partial [Athelia psychrophila]
IDRRQAPTVPGVQSQSLSQSLRAHYASKFSQFIWGTERGRRREVDRAMNVFGAGCVIAELFLEGAPLFTLGQLFKSREGELR